MADHLISLPLHYPRFLLCASQGLRITVTPPPHPPKEVPVQETLSPFFISSSCVSTIWLACPTILKWCRSNPFFGCRQKKRPTFQSGPLRSLRRGPAGYLFFREEKNSPRDLFLALSPTMVGFFGCFSVNEFVLCVPSELNPTPFGIHPPRALAIDTSAQFTLTPQIFVPRNKE